MSDTFHWDIGCLALDLGTSCGYASNLSGVFQAGTLELATAAQTKARRVERMDRRCDPRIRHFYHQLISLYQPHLVVFEDVQFQSYTMQCQLWSSYRTAAWLAFPKAHFECVPVSTLKKFATGHGGATKQMMAKALKVQFPERFVNYGETVVDRETCAVLDDNAVDAVWIWLWAKKQFGRMTWVDNPKCGDTV